VKLDIHSFASVVHHLEGVGAIAMHIAITVWDPSIGECDHCLMGCFGTEGDEIPEHVGVL